MGSHAYKNGVDKYMEERAKGNPDVTYARTGGNIMWAGYKEIVIEYMKCCGSEGKNWLKIVD